MNNYVVVSGFIASGASIVCDILKETKNTYVSDHEFKLITLPKGIDNIRRHIGENWHYLNSSESVRQFIELCRVIECNYDITGWMPTDFSESTNRLIYEMVDFYYELGTSVFSIDGHPDLFSSIIEKMRGKVIRKNNNHANRRIEPFIDMDYKTFFCAINKYIDSLFSFKPPIYDRIVLDMALTPSMSPLLDSYFPGGKMIVVDRDPRDAAVSMYNHAKGYGTELRHCLDSQRFCKWFLATRRVPLNQKNVRYYRAEDLIFQYENSVKDLLEFLEIDQCDHVSPRKYIDPLESGKKVGRWKSFCDSIANREEWFAFFDEINRSLPQYCFPN